MVVNPSVTPRTFEAVRRMDVDAMRELTEEELSAVLPCLVRSSLITSVDQSAQCLASKQRILQLLAGMGRVNSLVAILSVNFHVLEADVRKEQQLRQKQGFTQNESILVGNLQNSSLALEYERSDPNKHLRLLLSELFYVMSQTKDKSSNSGELWVHQSELLDNSVYLEELGYVLCIALAELPTLLPITDICQALLHVNHGSWMMCRVVANAPDCFHEVCGALISAGEKQDEESSSGRGRLNAIRQLCQMNPSQSLIVRSKCIEMCRMPALSVTLTLDANKMKAGGNDNGDVVAFVSGLLLGSDQNVRQWFSTFVRTGQKARREGSGSTLTALREELLRRLRDLVLFAREQELPEPHVVQASAMLRLYTAMKGIAGLKLSEEEVSSLLPLATSHPPPSPAGARFVSLGLCTLLACPSLLAQPEHEKRAVQWIKWLVKEEAYFQRSGSFGELLLLMAIHFHSNQMTAICDLVCSTLGMKIVIRPNTLSRMKTTFTHDIFTEQVVTAHAVKVPVTPNLSSEVTGFLPIHCIHQLLRSRAFTKYRVPIKDWIYRQIVSSRPPIHPMLPGVVEAYVQSMLVPNPKSAQEHSNEPISEAELLQVFQESPLCKEVPKARSRSSTPVKSRSAPRSPQKEEVDSLAAQLLLLYYLLLYEDMRLANIKTYLTTGRKKIHSYSAQLMAQLPIRYLLQLARKDQTQYAGLFAPLLKLLVTHYPYLCDVRDWTYEHTVYSALQKCTVTHNAVAEAFLNLSRCPARVTVVLEQLQSMPAVSLWPLAGTVVKPVKNLLEPSIPRRVRELWKEIWFRLNSVFPRRLWLMTVNALSDVDSAPPLSQDDVVTDPLHVLRCDKKVFRCGPILEVLITVLKAYLSWSSVYLSRHILENPMVAGVTATQGSVHSESEREELKKALVSTQEAAAIHILLESALPSEEELDTKGELTDWREAKSLICCHLHQTFIADPNLVKLVHFQGYSPELLPMTVSGVPSMHICLDFIPELLGQPEQERQVFAIQLLSYLCIQYAIPKSYSIARLAINTLTTLLGVLPSSTMCELFSPILPALSRMCRAFPPLCEDTVALLLQLAQVLQSAAALDGDVSTENLATVVAELAESVQSSQGY